MRRIVVFDRVSADGYFAGADGDLNWAVPDPDLDAAGASASAMFDTILFGRRTYDAFESFWPTAVSDAPTTADPHAAGRRSESLRAMGTFINDATKVVFSKTRKDVTWKNSRLLRAIEPGEMEAMKKEPGKGIIVFGSGSVVSELTRHGLIDEYQFVVSPILLGGGQSLLRGLSENTKVELLEAKPYPSGNVMLRYAPAS